MTVEIDPSKEKVKSNGKSVLIIFDEKVDCTQDMCSDKTRQKNFTVARFRTGMIQKFIISIIYRLALKNK